MPFVKGHGTENDFVVIPDAENVRELSAREVAAICDRRAGIGADGVLRVVRSAQHPDAQPMADEAPWFMDYRNADGSIAEMCGNGVRVFARYLADAGLIVPGEPLAIATRAGVRHVRFETDGQVTVGMGRVRLPKGDDASHGEGIRVGVGPGQGWTAVPVQVGNPHAVVTVSDLAEAGPLLEAPTVSPRSAFPHGVNVEFMVVREERHVAMRVHERGVGETRSCGTGACAAAVVHAHHEHLHPPVAVLVDVPGGRLTVTYLKSGEVELTGPAVLVAAGELRADWLAAVRQPG